MMDVVALLGAADADTIQFIPAGINSRATDIRNFCFVDVRTLKGPTVSLMKSTCILVFSVFVLSVMGCGKSNPNANVPPERIAPAPEDLGNDPEYVKQFGGKGKK